MTTVIGGAGIVGAAVPFVESWEPNAKARAIGAPVKIDISKIGAGAMVTVAWRGKPVWVLKRTEAELDSLKQPKLRSELRDPDSLEDQQPDYAKNQYRSIRPEIFVAIGVCTHLGCIPLYRPNGFLDVEQPVFFCPCHGSKYDLAGRVFKGVPAPLNLAIPPYHFLSDSVVEVGVDEKTSA